MFAKKYRISRERIEEFFKERTKNSQNDNFFVKKLENNLPHPRFSVIVSKKTEKLSTKRHQIKRRVLAQIKNLEKIQNFDFLITVKNNLKNKKHAEIKKELAELIK